MTMMRWEPPRDILTLRQAIDRLLGESFVRPLSLWPQLELADVPIDMYQTDKDVVVKATLPGVDAEDVEISVSGDILTMKGEHSEEEEVNEGDYIHRERRIGTFSRSVALPVPVDSNKADAVFDKGVLTVTLPKKEAAKPKKIKAKHKREAKGVKTKKTEAEKAKAAEGKPNK
jgi:HSP20 family protein